MPGFDGTGPAGGGPMTGGRRGYCSFSGPYYPERTRLGRNLVFGYGRGRGYRHQFWATRLPRWDRGDPNMRGPYSRPSVNRKSEIAMLKDEAEVLKEDLNIIQARIEDLEVDNRSDE